MNARAESRRQRWAERARRIRTDITALSLAMRDPRTPFAAKAVAALAVGYALSPIDLIPDVIPVLGYLDDLLIVPGLVVLALRLIPAEVMADARQRAASLATAGGKRWRYAIPIIAVWLVLLGVLAWWIWGLVT